MVEEPRIHKWQSSFGELNLELYGEQYKGLGILDTKVQINGQTLCWISWENKDDFISKLGAIIAEYSI